MRGCDIRTLQDDDTAAERLKIIGLMIMEVYMGTRAVDTVL
jgi:hypothetical protein